MKRVILVRTMGPRNAGLAARAAANFGPCELYLVAPEMPDLLEHREFIDMSHGAPRGGYPVVASLAEALAECSYSVGFSARIRVHRRSLSIDDMDIRRLRELEDSGSRVALVFGNDRDGLDGDEVSQINQLVRIPSSGDHPSLNLGVAVSIVLHRLFVEVGEQPPSKSGRLLDGAGRELLMDNLIRVTGKQIRGKAAKSDLEGAFSRVFGRAVLETRDARAIHRWLRQIDHPADENSDCED